MSFKYNEDILDTIVSVLLELESPVGEREVRYSKLYSNSVKLMRYGLAAVNRYGANYRLSPNYFYVHIKKMVMEGEIARREDLNSRLKIKPVHFSLTEKGRKRQFLKIRHEIIGQREKAYLLLLLYCAFGDIPSLPVDYGRNVLENEEQLEQFLSEVHLYRKDFKVERVDFNANQYKVNKMVEPTQKIRIHRIEYQQGSRGLEGRVEYRYILPGISIRQFLWGTKQGLTFEYIPESMSLSEVEECFELLLKEGLIKIVMRYRGEPRYDIENESLRNALKSCWLLCGVAEIAMRFIWENARLPTADERRWLELLGGKHYAMIYLNKCYEKLKTLEKDKKKGYRKVPSEIESNVRGLYGGIAKYFQEINTKYELISRELTSPLDVLIKVVYPDFLKNLVMKNEI